MDKGCGHNMCRCGDAYLTWSNGEMWEWLWSEVTPYRLAQLIGQQWRTGARPVVN